MIISNWIKYSELDYNEASELLFFVCNPKTMLDLKSWVIANQHHNIKPNKLAKLNRLASRRKCGEPLQYIKGYVDFCSLRLIIDKNVLIPRQETEELINLVKIHIMGTCFLLPASCFLTVADIGTGSGAIAIALAKFGKDHNLPLKVIATDISKMALKVANTNASSYKLQATSFINGRLLDPLVDPVDIVVANLPYIPTREIEKLDKSIKDFEPRVALDGGESGLDLIY